MKRINCKVLVFLIGIVLSCPVFSASRGKQELIPSGHWVYDAMTAISLESGIRNFADNSPLSIAEFKSYFYEIERDELSPAGKKQYDRIEEYFREKKWSYDSELFSAAVEPEINLEGYYKNNDDLSWIYDRYDRKPLFYVPVTFSVADYLTLGTELHLGENKGFMLKNDTYTNVPTSDTAVDVNFPDYGYLSTGYSFTDTCGLTFQLGMGPQSIGRTQTGSIILSDYMTGASYMKYTVYSPNIRYTYDAIQLNVDKYMYLHLLEFRFAKKLTLSAMEATLTNAPFELRYANPLTVFHGQAPWRDYGDEDQKNGEFMGLKLDWSPVKNLRLYGMFAMNQYQVPYEKREFSDDKTPNSLGGQLGLEGFAPMGKGYFHFATEGYYANPYMYIKQSPKWSFFRTYTDNIGANEIFYEWTGSPFGPDTIAGELSLGYENPGNWSVDLIYLYLCQGENAEKGIFCDGSEWFRATDSQRYTEPNNNWPYPTERNSFDQNAVTPTGTPKYTNRVSLRGKLQANRWLSFTFQPSYVIIFNNNGSNGKRESGRVDWGLEAALAVKCQLTKLK